MYSFDPLAFAAEQEEKDRFHHDLFQPIWEFQAQLTPRFLIQDWIPEGALVILAGEPKCGKTSLATQLALAVATGTPFAGMPTTQSSVLWMALEENGPERRLLLSQNPLAEPSTPLYTGFEALCLDKDETYEALDFWIERTHAKLIVIDPLQSAIPNDLTKNWQARRHLQRLKVYCYQRRITAIVLHHVKHPSRGKVRVAESDQLSATASMFVILKFAASHQGVSHDHEHSDSNQASKVRLISLACQGRGEFANRTIHLISDSPSSYKLADSFDLAQHQAPVAPPSNKALEILEFISRRPATMVEIARELNVTPYTLRGLITELRTIGKITMHRDGSHSCIYALSTLTKLQAIKAHKRPLLRSEDVSTFDKSDIPEPKNHPLDPTIDTSFSNTPRSPKNTITLTKTATPLTQPAAKRVNDPKGVNERSADAQAVPF